MGAAGKPQKSVGFPPQRQSLFSNQKRADLGSYFQSDGLVGSRFKSCNGIGFCCFCCGSGFFCCCFRIGGRSDSGSCGLRRRRRSFIRSGFGCKGRVTRHRQVEVGRISIKSRFCCRQIVSCGLGVNHSLIIRSRSRFSFSHGGSGGSHCLSR